MWTSFPEQAVSSSRKRFWSRKNDGTRILNTDNVIIAVGTKPARPAGIEFDDRKIIDSDGLLKLREIPRTMTFVGGGIIGVEYANHFFEPWASG